jgi:hypothetical protein
MGENFCIAEELLPFEEGPLLLAISYLVNLLFI